MWPACVPPLPPEPDPGGSQAVDRHPGMWCGCSLLDCCHDENGNAFGCGREYGRHVHSGNPATGYLYPWEPGDESWRTEDFVSILTGAGARNIRLAY